jgi:DNA-binding beta-propeller fold protein YncE
VGAAGDLFVADAELGWVVHLDASGEPLAPVGRGQLLRPTGLARDAASGRLYVADTAAHDIKVFDAAGRLERTLGRRGSGPGEFNFPSHLAWAGGALYVSDTLNARIQVLRPDEPGVAPWALGARGLYLGNLVRPKGVAVDAEGHIYVVESYHDRLLVYDADGAFLLPVGGTGTAPGAFYLPAGAWIDAAQQVYVADMFNGRVLRFQYLVDSGGGGG